MATYKYSLPTYQNTVCSGVDVRGVAIVTGPVSEVVGTGWKYNVKIGWEGQFAAIYNGNINFSITLGGKTANYTQRNINTGSPSDISYKTWYTPTFSITVPYGKALSGRMSGNIPTTLWWTCYTTGITYPTPALNFGGNVSTSGNPTVPQPSKPAEPSKLVVSNPSNITTTSAYITANLYGNDNTLNYYHMRVKNKATGQYLYNPFYTAKYSGYENGSATLQNLKPETTYTLIFEVYDKNGKKLNKSGFTVEKTFTTKTDQAYIYKKDSAWQRGKAWIKVNGAWVKGKRVYHKVNGQWVASKGSY